MGTYILNKKQAVAFKLSPAHYNVMIRITSPITEFKPLENSALYREVLQLKFFDLDQDTFGLKLFNKTHLEQCITFFERHKSCQNMVIHCDEGRSRSAGVAVGWFLFHDNRSSIYKLYHDKVHLPNRLVVTHFYRFFGKNINVIDKWEEECYNNILKKA